MRHILILLFVAISAFSQVRDAFPRTPVVLTVATLPPSPPTNMRATVSDGSSATDCTTGGGSTVVDCRYTGSAWTAAGSGGSGGGSMLPFIETSGMAQALTRYASIGLGQVFATEANRAFPFAKAGTVTNLVVDLTANVGGSGQTIVFTVRKNAADTSLTCTISTGASTCSDTTNTVSFARGDLYSVKIVTSATTGTLFPRMSVEVQ